MSIPQPRATPDRRILVVDDDPMIRVIVSRTLELGGYRVELADCGARAMEALSAHPDAVELVITDLVMPGMSGQELIGAICERWPHIRIMWISAYTAEVVVAGGEHCSARSWSRSPGGCASSRSSSATSGAPRWWR
jgi:CheY-like chemotaxis protein